MEWELLYHPKYGILKEAQLFQEKPPDGRTESYSSAVVAGDAEGDSLTPPSHWYNYRCRSCEHRDWVEDIIVDGFPPTEPGGCPALICRNAVASSSEIPLLRKKSRT